MERSVKEKGRMESSLHDREEAWGAVCMRKREAWKSRPWDYQTPYVLFSNEKHLT